ncbi:uncharacterized protein [Amphiura filiformis]|uniref:uncharacterized protein isoform X2 n=1 Tax=Amphiura filiformis TaxID=82378 RepID=UPI003B20FA29
MDEISNDPKRRIYLWTAPRSLATVFTKCMSFVEGVQIIKEPILTAHVLGPEGTAAQNDEFQKTCTTFKEAIPLIPESKAAKMDLAFDPSKASFQWVKDMLESDFHGKSFVFVHDQAFCLRNNYGNIPRSFRHTFLIRNPHRVFPSYKKMMVKAMPSFIDKPFSDMPKVLVPAKFGYGELYDLMVHVKEKLGQSAIVIDADDLQANPASVLRQYCNLLGVEFKESMLQWEAGDGIVNTWIANKTGLQGNKMEEGGYFEDAFRSTEFHPPKEMPSRKQIDPDLLPVIDQCMPIYEQMYSVRIRPW